MFFFREGKIVTLKEEDSDIEIQKSYRSHYIKNKRRSKTKKAASSGKDVNEERGEQVKPRSSKKRAFNKIKSGDDNVFSDVAEVRNICNRCIHIYLINKLYIYHTYLLQYSRRKWKETIRICSNVVKI